LGALRQVTKALYAKLNLPGVAGLIHLSEIGVAHQAIRVAELSMVRGVGELGAKDTSPKLINPFQTLP
jgi:hypothetical protein